VPEPGTDYGKYVLVVKVKEQKTGLATLGLGYTGGGSGPVRSGITGAISFSERNFQGRGLGASVQWQRGVNIDSLALSYFDPAINKRQDSINISYYSQVISELRQPVTGTDPIQYALYDDKRSGGSFTFGHPLNDDLRVFLSLRKESLDFSRSSTSLYAPVGMGHGEMNAVSLGALYDTRDDVFNPHEGLYVNTAVTKGGPPVGGDYDFTKLYLETRKYYPLRRGKTLALRAWGGTLSGTSPLTEIFYAGGADSIRGYQENSFFGTQFVVLNAELRFPIANIKMLNGAVFADAGNAWGNLPNSPVTAPDNSSGKLFFDAGVGVRLVFPTLGLGVIRVDYAFGERGGRSSIGIGQTF
jgi:outer membrane protein insertion porin family